QRLLHQLLDLPAGPVAVVALEEPVVEAQGGGPTCEKRRRGLLAALQGAGDDLHQGYAVEPSGQPLGVLLAHLVEVDAAGAAGEHAGGVGRAPTVSQQDDCRHGWAAYSPAPDPDGWCGAGQALMTPADRRPSTRAPRPTR